MNIFRANFDIIVHCLFWCDNVIFLIVEVSFSRDVQAPFIIMSVMGLGRGGQSV